jgi:hypothetical protein
MSKEISAWVQLDFSGGNFQRIASDLHETVSKVNDRIDKLPSNAEWASDEAYAESETVEGLIGTAFVLYQTYLTSVVSSVKGLATDGYAGAPSKKVDVLRLESAPITAAVSYSRMEVVNAVANYFKHRDEWPADWSAATGQTKDTVDVISAIGLSSNEHFNLMKAAKALGDDAFDGTCPLVREMQSWREAVLKKIEETS